MPKNSQNQDGASAAGPREHDLKCHPKPFNAVASGRKTFEWRKNDRGYRVGDILNLRDWDPEFERYTGAHMRVRVTYMISEGFGIPEGYCIMAIEPATRFREVVQESQPSTAPAKEGGKA